MVWFLAGARQAFYSKVSRLPCGPPNLVFSGYQEALSPGINWVGHETDCWPLSIAGVKNEWHDTSSSPLWRHFMNRDMLVRFDVLTSCLTIQVFSDVMQYWWVSACWCSTFAFKGHAVQEEWFWLLDTRGWRQIDSLKRWHKLIKWQSITSEKTWILRKKVFLFTKWSTSELS